MALKRSLFRNYKVLAILGILLFIANAGNQFRHLDEFIGAIILLLGALVCYLRKNAKWLPLEIISLIVLIFFVFLALNDNVYANPLNLLATSIGSVACYIYTFWKTKSIAKNQAN